MNFENNDVIKIKWKNLASMSYTYGSEIRYIDNNTVFFENSLMPSGVSIIKWSSNVNFQSNKISVELPLLVKNQNYSMKANFEETPKNSVYIRIDFYDRYKKQVGFKIFREKSGEFTYLDNAYYYEISLINAGCNKLIFNDILLNTHEIVEKNDKLTNYNSLILNEDIFIINQNVNSLGVKDDLKDIIKDRNNVILINNIDKDNIFDLVVTLKSKISEINPKNIFLINYVENSNKNMLELAYKLNLGKVYLNVTSESNINIDLEKSEWDEYKNWYKNSVKECKIDNVGLPYFNKIRNHGESLREILKYIDKGNIF